MPLTTQVSFSNFQPLSHLSTGRLPLHEWQAVGMKCGHTCIYYLSFPPRQCAPPFYSPVFPKVTTTHPMGQGQTLPLSPLWSASDLLRVETLTRIQLHLTSALSSWTISKTLSTLWACHFLPTSSSRITDHRKLLLPQTLGAQLQPTETVIYSICVSLSC